MVPLTITGYGKAAVARGVEYHRRGRRGHGGKNSLHLCVLRDLCGFPFVPAEPLVEQHYAEKGSKAAK
ncbi:MAG: hypothetical protein PHV74_14065 [Dehalococcoidia bacterium]|nr:hypothetical protein [Dehalococcoidia bacterium]